MTVDTMKIERWIASENIMRIEDRRMIEARARTIRAALLAGLLARGWSAMRRAAGAAIGGVESRLPGAA